jgi:superfamily I DNA/RNA helicase
VAVVTPASLVAEAFTALKAAPDMPGGPPSVGEASVDGLGRAVTVVAAEGAKGLEFDAVVVVAPGAIVAERPDRAAGLRLLYVALTRPTQHLSVVHTGDLPDALVPAQL